MLHQLNRWIRGSMLELAEKYGCSTPTIDKALACSYAQDGMPLPTRMDRKKAKILQARAMVDADHSLDDIAKTLDFSDVTARQYLRESFAAERWQANAPLLFCPGFGIAGCERRFVAGRSA